MATTLLWVADPEKYIRWHQSVFLPEYLRYRREKARKSGSAPQLSLFR